MMYVTQRTYEARLEDIGGRKGRLSVKRIEGEGPDRSDVISIDYGFNHLTNVFSGEFDIGKYWRRNVFLKEIVERYGKKVGKHKVPQNLAYLLLTAHPTHFFREEFNNGFEPLSNSDMASLVWDATSSGRAKGLGKNEPEIFLSCDYYRHKMHDAGEKLLKRKRNENRFFSEIRDLVQSYNQVKFFIDGVIEANMGIIFNMRKKIRGNYDGDDLIDSGFESALRAVEGFDFRKGFKLGTYLGRAVYRDMIKAVDSLRRRGGQLQNEGDILMNPKALERETEEGVRLEVLKEVVDGKLAELNDRENEIIQRRYGLGKKKETLEKVGKRLGITRERTRQLQEEAKGKLCRAVRKKYIERFGEDPL